MCYSLNASIFSFCVGILSCLYLASMDLALSLYLGFIVLMQLIDIIFWTHQNINHRHINGIMTKVAAIVNVSQPIVLALVIFCINMKTIQPIAIVFTMLYILYTFINLYIYWDRIDYTLVIPSSKILYWKWNDLPGSFVFLMLYLACTYTLILTSFHIDIAIILISSLTITLIMGSNKDRAIGRFWCYFASFIPFFIALYMGLGT